MWLANMPVYGIYSWFALRARHLFFFSNVNPAIPLGGAWGESKHAILELIPARIRPKTIFIPAGTPYAEVARQLSAAGMTFPVVAKPDVGERGFLIKKTNDAEELRSHLERFPANFLVQEFLEHPMEATVLFYRFPDGRFGITSVCTKEFLTVEGDGVSTVRQLMARTTRAAFQLERFEREQPGLLNQIPEAGKFVLLEPIGNHARGTKFLNANHLIDSELERAFEQVCAEIDGVLLGRFDLKCASVDALRRGEVLVMELNGVFGEPAHIFDPAYGAWRVYRDYYRHWKMLFDLHRAQVQRGITPTPHGEAIRFIREYFRYKKRLETL